MTGVHRDDIARLEALHAAHPDGRVFVHLADAYRRTGDLVRARELLDRGLRSHAGYASAHVVLARVLRDDGAAEEAIAAYRRVVELDPRNLEALRSLGELLAAAGRRGDALAYAREAAAIDPGDEGLRRLVAGLEEEAAPAEAPGARGTGGDDAAAEDAVAEPFPGGVPVAGEAGLATETLADLYARQGLTLRAIAVYRRLLEERPGDERLLGKLRELEARVGSDPGPAGGEGESGPAESASAWAGEGGAEDAAAAPALFTLADEEPIDGAGDDPGETIGGYLAGLLAWRPGGVGAAPATGDAGAGLTAAGEGAGATAGAAQADAAGSDGLARAEAAPAAPGAPVATPAEAGEPGPGTVLGGDIDAEFDRLFDQIIVPGEPGEAAEPRSAAEEAAPAEERGGAAEDDDDLERFREWLESLKR